MAETGERQCMTVKEVFELREQGRTEEAYNAARQLYAKDKGAYASTAMFWSAVDMLRLCACKDRTEEAEKILKALERLLPNVPDRDGWAGDAFQNCQLLLHKTEDGKEPSKKSAEHLQLGAWGEGLAAAYLSEKGYIILERDWRSGHRDIDIVARNDEYLIFVEVKTRRNSDFGDPVTAVDNQKMRNLQRAINHYIRYRHVNLPIRFDIISIIGHVDSKNPQITHFEGIDIMGASRR